MIDGTDFFVLYYQCFIRGIDEIGDMRDLGAVTSVKD